MAGLTTFHCAMSEYPWGALWSGLHEIIVSLPDRLAVSLIPIFNDLEKLKDEKQENVHTRRSM